MLILLNTYTYCHKSLFYKADFYYRKRPHLLLYTRVRGIYANNIGGVAAFLCRKFGSSGINN